MQTNVDYLGVTHMQCTILFIQCRESPYSCPRGYFYERVKDFPGLAYEMANYHRLPVGHAERSYAYLWNSSKRYLARALQERNRVAQSRFNRELHVGGRDKSPAAATPSQVAAADHLKNTEAF